MYRTAYQQGYESVFIKLGLDPEVPKAAPVPPSTPAPTSTLAPALAPKPAVKPLPPYIAELMKRFNKNYRSDQDAYYEVNTQGTGGNTDTYGIDINKGKLNIQRGRVSGRKPWNTFTLPEELARDIVSGKKDPVWAALRKRIKYTGDIGTIKDLNSWVPVYKYKK